jgi:arylsulfatase A-like enzyme
MPRPNILIFMTDQQRGDTVLPRSAALMPNVARFREEGVTFTEAFCPSPHCCPSRATFFTGLYPAQHGVWNNVTVGNTLSRGLAEGVRTWSEDLASAGYRMRFCGKWHVSDLETPGDRGWDGPRGGGRAVVRRNWEPYKSMPAPAKLRSAGQIATPGFPEFRLYGECDEDPAARGMVGDDLRVVDKAIANLRALAEENSTQPWSMFVGCIGPHDPYIAPRRFLDLYKDAKIELPRSFSDDLTDKPNFYRRTRQLFDQLSEQEQREALRHYYAFCSFEDDLFGRVLNALQATGQAENTIVMFCSDHGDYAAEHGLWCKGVPCFRGAYHVPMIVRWPKQIVRPGRNVDALVSLADVAPTLLDAAGIGCTRAMAGKTLIPFLRDDPPGHWRDALFTQTNGNELYGIQRSIFTKDFKFVYNGFDFDELYDLRHDPDEMRNLADDPRHKDLMLQMMRRIWEFSHETGDLCTNSYIMVRFPQCGPAVVFQNAENLRV